MRHESKTRSFEHNRFTELHQLIERAENCARNTAETTVKIIFPTATNVCESMRLTTKLTGTAAEFTEPLT